MSKKNNLPILFEIKKRAQKRLWLKMRIGLMQAKIKGDVPEQEHFKSLLKRLK